MAQGSQWRFNRQNVTIRTFIDSAKWRFQRLNFPVIQGFNAIHLMIIWGIGQGDLLSKNAISTHINLASRDEIGKFSEPKIAQFFKKAVPCPTPRAKFTHLEKKIRHINYYIQKVKTHKRVTILE